MDINLLKQLYNVFDPLRPLPAGDKAYVDCTNVRGDEDIIQQLGRDILFSDKVTCQLYAGHRGAGKSTELLRLKQYLEENNFDVVYFAADDQDIDTEDAKYTDILLTCIRHLLEKLQENADASPVVTWLEQRWQSLKDVLGSTEISFEKGNITLGIAQFAKVTALLHSAPNTRQKIRQEVENHTPSLIQVLNQFIEAAKEKLKEKQSPGIVVIADNLDRIVPVYKEGGKRSNHDEIFLDRCEQLRKLQCHTIYTDRATVLYEKFGNVQPLPMILIRTPEGDEYPPGMEKLQELIAKRIQKVDENLALTQVFKDEAILKQLCFMSGGHVRYLMFLVKTALKRTMELPITEKEVLSAIAELRRTYSRAINDDEWSILAQVYKSKKKPNDEQHQKLLFNRCILEYPSVKDNYSEHWHDVHPIILELEEFKAALRKLDPPPSVPPSGGETGGDSGGKQEATVGGNRRRQWGGNRRRQWGENISCRVGIAHHSQS